MSYQYEPLVDEIVFQDFLKDLYNCIYKTNSFEVYRSKGYSQYGVDVYSPELKIAIQAKKKNILRKEPELIQELKCELIKTLQDLKQFPHPVEKLYFATTTKKYAAIQDEALKNSRPSLGVQFWSWEDIQTHISDYVSIREKYFRHLSTQILPKELVLTPHLNPADFVGRDNDIERLKTLFQTNRIIYIKGIGGQGKSSVAKLYYQNCLQDYEHLLWFDYNGNLRHTLTYNEALNINLKLNDGAGNSFENKYQHLLNAISTLKGKTLLVLDNIQHEPDISVELEIKKLLAKQDIHILLASREVFSSFHQYPLTSLSSNDARTIFRAHCTKQIDIAKLDELLAMIDNNPLVTELIAKTINTAIGLTVDDMIRHISQGTLDDDELGIHIDSEQNNLFKKIKALVRVDELEKNPYNFYIALTFSLLPSVFIPIEDLIDVFMYREPSRTPIINAFSDLDKKGLITRVGDNVKMHQLIQDAIRAQIPDFAGYLGIINSLIRTLNRANSKYSSKGYHLQGYTESFLNKLVGEKALSLAQPLLMIKNNLYLMYRYLGERNKSKRIIEDLKKDVATAQPLVLSDPVFFSTLHHNFATSYMDEKRYDLAEKEFLRAIEINGETSNPNVIHCYNGLFILYWNQGKLQQALESSVKALELLQKPHAAENDHLSAMVANNIAAVYMEFGDLSKAAGFITMALKLHRESANPEKNEAALARYCSSAAETFSRMENHEVAIQFALHAIEYRGNLNLERDFELLYFYERAADVYEKAGEEEKTTQLREIVKTARVSFDGNGEDDHDSEIIT